MTQLHTDQTEITVVVLDGRSQPTTFASSSAAILITVNSRTLEWTLTVQPDGSIQAAMQRRIAPLSTNSSPHTLG